MKSNRDLHGVLRREGNSYPLKFLSNETLENRNEKLPMKEKLCRNVREVVCKLLQVLQHAHLHPTIFHVTLRKLSFLQPVYNAKALEFLFITSSSYCKVCISSFSVKVQSRRFAF